MRSLNDTITRLAALGNRPEASADLGSSRLRELAPFGSNPGALRGFIHLPPAPTDHAPLVVVLHGCTQSAADYDHGAGWSDLADELDFAVLLPEQQRGNNPNRCFNWFDPADIRRDGGEALSIRQMVATMLKEHRLDPERVFVTGLSAGGAMASVLLATYPEVFAGGAIIAGLPYGTARSTSQAFDRMRAHGGPRGGELGALVAAASPHAGPWPTISVWHGDADATVSADNADLIVDQWRGLHSVGQQASRTEVVGRDTHRTWTDASGRDVIEQHRIARLGHGLPLSATGPDSCGVPGAYMLEAGISSTRRIAEFWGLSRPRSGKMRPRMGAAALEARPAPSGLRTPARPQSVADVIADALRAAGLIR